MIYVGDCIEWMKSFPDDSISSCVTDPPYGLEFMGKEWDRLGAPEGFRRTKNPADVGRDTAFGRLSARAPEYAAGAQMQAWHLAWAREVLRILKPGGYLLAFGGSRTHHRLMCAIEDAGFEIRDVIMWLYGSGFPKSMDVSKAIDKEAGAEREVVGVKPGHEGFVGRQDHPLNNGWDRPWASNPEAVARYHAQTAPATEEAKRWSGWGTALKPAYEPIIVARKPLVGTVAKNVLAHGTGALNIDACRIVTTDNLNGGAYSGGKRPNSAMNCVGEVGGTSSMLETGGGRLDPSAFKQPTGRWPPNVILDEEAGALLDAQVGRPCGQLGPQLTGSEPSTAETGIVTGLRKRVAQKRAPDAPGGPSRFFYCPKVSAVERGDSKHPTMKPLALIHYLVRLVTPPGGIVLDPFAGSGTTGLAAREEGFGFVLIEQDASYVEIIKKRLGLP